MNQWLLPIGRELRQLSAYQRPYYFSKFFHTNQVPSTIYERLLVIDSSRKRKVNVNVFEAPRKRTKTPTTLSR
jgi:hypothetical protein